MTIFGGARWAAAHLAVFCAAALTAGALHADTITNWLGGTSSNYGTAANWSNGVANGAFSATIPGGTTFEPVTTGNNYTLDNLTLSNAGATLGIGDNTGILVNASNGGSITNNGTLSMNSAGDFTSLILEGTSTVTLGGTGTLTMNSAAHDRIWANNAGLTLINNSTIQGAGQLVTNGNVGTAYAFTNNGTVSATGGNLTVSTLGGTTNTGTLQAASGGTLLLLNDGYTQTGNGTILAQNGGTVNLQNATISGGTLTTQGTGTITTFSNTTSTLSGAIRISSGSTLTAADNGSFNLAPGLNLTNNGTLALNSAGNLTQLALNGAGTVTLNGTGTYMLDDNSHNRIIANVTGATLVNNSTIQGSGEMINSTSVGQPYAIVNNGTITASGTTGLTIQNGADFNNNGELLVSTADSLRIVSGTTFDNYSNTTNTLTGGEYDISGTLQFQNANIVNNASSITLTGSGSAIVDQNSHDALANFDNNEATGSFSIQGGRNFSTSSMFTNAGMLTVGSTDTFMAGEVIQNAGLIQVSGTMTVTGVSGIIQSGGTTQVDGSVTAASLSVQGGILKGSGTFFGAVTVGSGGSVDPGDSPGTLTINGNYTMGSGSNFGVLFAGDTPGLWDVLDVNGAATLNGALNLTTMAGFIPVAGQQFDIMNYTSHSGAFSSVTGTDLGYGYSFSLQYNPTDVVLTVDGPVGGAAPEPGTSLLLGLGLVGIAACGWRRWRV